MPLLGVTGVTGGVTREFGGTGGVTGEFGGTGGVVRGGFFVKRPLISSRL